MYMKAAYVIETISSCEVTALFKETQLKGIFFLHL